MKQSLIIVALISLAFVTHTVAQDTATLLNTAKAAIEKQDYPAALSALDTIIKREPGNDTAYAQKARAYVRQNKLDLALPEAEKAIKINPKNYEALNVRGIVRRDQLKDVVGALDDFTKALAVKPDYYFAALNQGITLSMMGKLADASAAYDKAAALDPKSSGPYAQRARFLMRYGRYQQAIPDLDKVISLDPNNSNNYALRGFAHFRLLIDSKSTLANIKSDAEKALQLSDRNDLAYALRGLVRYEENAIDPAMADAEKAIQVNPKGYLGFVVRAFVKEAKKDFDGTFEDLDQALKLAPKDKWVKSRWDIAVRNSPAAQAKIIELAKQKVAANPWDFKAYDELSDAFNNSRIDGKIEKAYWDSLVAQNPKNICAIRFLGEYKSHPDYRDMLYFLDDGLRLYDGKNGAECAAEIARRIAREYDSRQDYDLAKTYYDKAKAIKPDLGGLDSNVAEMARMIDRNKAEDERLTKRLAELDKTRTQTSNSNEKRISDEEFRAIIAVKKGFDELNKHTQQFSEYAKTWNSDPIEQEKDLALSMKSECESVLAIAENLLSKYPRQLSANDTDYLTKTIAKMKTNLAKIERLLKKFQ